MIRTVLLAACHREVLEAAEIEFRLAGLRVAVAESGLAAIRQARTRSPDLVVLDHNLGDMDGLTAADILGCLPSTAGIPTMLLRPAPANTSQGNADAPESSNEKRLLTQIGHALQWCRKMEEPVLADYEPAPANLNLV